MNHNQLAASLAQHLRHRYGRVTWENLELGGGSRPDVFSVHPTLSSARCRPWTHEVKISRSDFLRDARSGKWRGYKMFSCRVFFACPAGLILPVELPTGSGLWEFDGQWRMTKPASFCKGWSLTDRDLMKLILGRWGTYQASAPQPVARLSVDGATDSGLTFVREQS